MLGGLDPAWRGDPLLVYPPHKAADVSLNISLVEIAGLEPATSCLQSRRSSQLNYIPNKFLLYFLYIINNMFWKAGKAGALTSSKGRSAFPRLWRDPA